LQIHPIPAALRTATNFGRATHHYWYSPIWMVGYATAHG
jgi:hypothetical protein